ncbi:MAG: serine/threonine protein kinase [Planctomycetota bacterium]
MSNKRTRRIVTLPDLLLENGLLTEEQIATCMADVDEASNDGKTITFEDAVLARKFVDPEKVKSIKVALDRLNRDKQKTDAVRIGNYEIVGKLGDGGLGTVYKAYQLSMGRPVALKVLHKKWDKDDEFKKRFLLEAKLAGRLSHGNLIQVFDVGKDRGQYYFSMEFIDGETVEAKIDREGPLPVPEALDITIQVLRAIAHLKRHNVVHRDIKPGNIMLTKSGQVKLGDFGFVLTHLDQYIANEGEVLGTPDYIAPEVAMGEQNIDWRSDQYSLGCSLYHMVVGKPPFEGTGSSVMRQHIRAELPDPRSINPDVPDKVVHILERMLAKSPGDRYQEPEELFQDLELVKMGQNPTSDRLDVGKSTIIRAFKLQHNKAERASRETDRLRDEIRVLKRLLYVAFGVIVALIGAALLLAIKGHGH